MRHPTGRVVNRRNTWQLARRQLRRLLAVGIVGATIVSLLVACGIGGAGALTDNDKEGSGFSKDAVAQRVEVATVADGTLSWDHQVYQARAGDVTFVVRNPSPLVHQFSVEGNGVNARSPHLAVGSTTTYTLKGLAPGEYRIVCNFPAHREAGMIARLIVT